MKEDLRKSCYSNAKAKHGPKTHHICFYFGYGANSFGKKNKMRRKGEGRGGRGSGQLFVQAAVPALLFS